MLAGIVGRTLLSAAFAFDFVFDFVLSSPVVRVPILCQNVATDHVGTGFQARSSGAQLRENLCLNGKEIEQEFPLSPYLMLKRIWVVALLLCAFLQVAAQKGPSSQEQKLDRLIVYGDGFSFGVKEPDDWHADTGDLARKQQANVLFTPTQPPEDDQITIRVRVNSKVDENTVEDLNYDMQQYKKDYPHAEFSDLSVQHPKYKTFAKLVYVPDRFYEYVAYVNPGTVSKFNFSVAMSKKLKLATPDELKAFETVLRSLVWVSKQHASNQQ